MGDKTATELYGLEGWRGDARLYRLSVPISYRDGENREKKTYYVVVSAVNAYSGPETYIFPCNQEGQTYNMGELGGSFRGGCDHQRALENAGFTTIPRY